jgi:hypothetical protein
LGLVAVVLPIAVLVPDRVPESPPSTPASRPEQPA